MFLFVCCHKAKSTDLSRMSFNLSIKAWIANNFFQLNSNKTEVIVFIPLKSTSSLASRLNYLTPCVKSHKKNLGIILNSELCFDKQISSVVKKNLLNYCQTQIFFLIL